MPKLLECKDMKNICTLWQEYVIGTKFVDWIKENNIILYLDQHLEFFDILLRYQFYSYCLDDRLRIDFNLKNFIMKDHKLYLVDIMPPIFIDYDIVKKGKVYSKKISQLMDLYMNIDYQIIGMIGYWILDSLDNLSKVMEPYRRQKICAILMKFIEHANTYIEMYRCDICRINRTNIYNYADNYFFKGLYLLYEYIDNHEDVCPIEGEYVVEKQMPNSFLGTNLKNILDSEGIKQIIVTGMMSNICVASTVMAAKDLGYEVIVAEDACTTKDFCFAEEVMEAHIVHKVCMSSLKGIYANVIITHEVIRHYLS